MFFEIFIYFNHILPCNLPSHPTSCSFPLLKKTKTINNKNKVWFMLANYPSTRPAWSVADIPSVITLKKADFPLTVAINCKQLTYLSSVLGKQCFFFESRSQLCIPGGHSLADWLQTHRDASAPIFWLSGLKMSTRMPDSNSLTFKNIGIILILQNSLANYYHLSFHGPLFYSLG